MWLLERCLHPSGGHWIVVDTFDDPWDVHEAMKNGRALWWRVTTIHMDSVHAEAARGTAL
jgi:hypothetical protein